MHGKPPRPLTPSAHPRTRSREAPKPLLSLELDPIAADSPRAIVYARTERASWIDRELERTDTVVQIARSIAHIISATVDDPPPRPQILIIDIDGLSAGELLELHAVRERGWCGTIIALGRAPAALRRSLAIGCVLGAPFIDDALRDQITAYREAASTATIPIPRALLDGHLA